MMISGWWKERTGGRGGRQDLSRDSRKRISVGLDVDWCLLGARALHVIRPAHRMAFSSKYINGSVRGGQSIMSLEKVG